MVTVKCQYTNIEFEAASKRAKNHPAVSAMLAKANIEGTYREAKKAIAAGVEKGFSAIEEFEVFVSERISSAKNRREESDRVARVATQQRKVERKQRKSEREALNATLQAHGYAWSKVETSSEYGEAYHAGWGEADGWEWQLYAPDGRAVTIKQASAEIAAA